MVIAYTSISALRQQTRPVDVIQGQISHGGVAPNIIHAYAAGNWSVRSDTRAHLRQLIKKVEACLEAAAVATGVTLKMTPEMSYDDQMPNRPLGGGYRKFWNMMGGNIPSEQIDLIEGRGSFSSDERNVSYALPSICFSFVIDSAVGGHNLAFAHAAKTKASFETALKISKALAATRIEVLSRKGYLEEIKEEWREDIAKEKAA
jgi:metal-dependent amidase/aminoacylase/carboxypeptidase family protein